MGRSCYELAYPINTVELSANVPIGVKICGLTRPRDVEAAVEAGADGIGIVLDRGPRKVTPAEARVLLDAARGAAVERVAVTGDLPRSVRETAAELGFDVVQAVATDDLLAAPGPLPVLPVFFDGPDLIDRVDAWRALWSGADPRPRSLVGTLNVDGAGGGGTGTRADWRRARRVAERGPLTLSGGLRVENLAAALAAVPAHAVDVCSGVESTPGVKSAVELRAFLREVRRLEASPPEAA